MWNQIEWKWKCTRINLVQCVLWKTENGNSLCQYSTHKKTETLSLSLSLSRNRLKYVKVEKAPVSAIYYSCVNIFLFPPTPSL